MRSSFRCATGYSILLPWYDSLVAAFTREDQAKQHLVDQAATAGHIRLLDVGCGSGTLLLRLLQNSAELGHCYRLLAGVDIDSRMLKQARRKLASARIPGSSEVQLLQASCQDLPFEDGSFDVIATSLLMHHLEDESKQQCLEEMKRVLTPDGRVILMDYGQPDSRFARLLFLPVQLVDGWRSTQALVEGRLPALIRQAGFNSVKETLHLATPLGTLRCYLATSKLSQRSALERTPTQSGGKNSRPEQIGFLESTSGLR